jgi:hypothetical protein
VRKCDPSVEFVERYAAAIDAAAERLATDLGIEAHYAPAFTGTAERVVSRYREIMEKRDPLVNTVLIASEKHGTFVYASALACLRNRLRLNWYDDQTQTEAEAAVAAEDEYTCEAILQARSDYEYEYVEWVDPID